MIDLAAYVASALILIAYAWQARTGDPGWFNLANAVLWVPIVASTISHRAFPSLVITLAFGLIGSAGLVRTRGLVAS